ncbi:hypothetical protein VP01_557g4 [Puccinia sorghi]|uniref:Uncharacterized protein n=1 Tax=Puccinia sorghi TaxID=27349 RepID=A0A0L6UJV9_9BASI|nr:hypothetical protein VP01_557g4 [Puccinia sorghi]
MQILFMGFPHLTSEDDTIFLQTQALLIPKQTLKLLLSIFFLYSFLYVLIISSCFFLLLMLTDQSKNILLNHVKWARQKTFGRGSCHQKKVASESNERFASAGSLIRDATRTGVAPIKWHIYLLQSPSLPKFSKDSQYLITNQASSSHWIKAVAALCKDKVFSGFQLRMEILGAVESQATAAAKAQNHLLRNQGTSNKTNHDFPPSLFEDLFNLYKEKTMQTWDHSLNLGTPGVLINSPPASLFYLNLNSKKQRPSSSSSSTREMGEILLKWSLPLIWMTSTKNSLSQLKWTVFV